MSEEVRQLAEILAHTFNPDVTKRAPAEEHLKKIEESAPNYHSCLLQLVTINEIPLDIRQAAVLRLKNLCNEFWSITTGEGVRISETDRKVIKENILEAIIFQPAPVIRVQLLEVFYVAVKFDWPDSWESVLPAIMRNIKSDDRARVFGALQALQMIFRVYQYKGKDKRGPVADLVTLTFPVMLAIVTHVSTLAPSLEGFEIIQVVARIFYLATQLSIPPHLDNAATLQPWMSFWLGLLELPLPESMNPKDPAHIYRNPLWRAKKWTCQTINRLFSVWGRPQSVSKEGQKFARLFFDRFSKPCLAAYLKLLLQKKEQNNVPPRVVQLAYVYLTHTVTLTALYKPLKPHIRFLLLESVLPTMCLSPADLTTWKEDPHEFVKRDLDIMEQFHDPRVAATNLLVSLVKYRTRDSLELTLSACTSILQAYAEEPDVSKKNYLLKEGALRMIGCLRKLLLNTESLAASVEPLLITHVFPEFANPIGFMRARACAVVGQFNKLEWVSEAHHAQAVQHVTLALRDTELPVKLEAAIAISRLVNEGKIVQFIRPHLQMILDQFFVLMDEIGNEEVVTTLANLIDMFDKEIIPYALVMTKRLAHMFTELLKAPAADDESALTAQQCLVAINTILYAVDSVPEIYESIEAILAPVLDVLVNERCMEFFDDTLECIGCLAYFPKKISDFSWSLLPRILASFFTWAPDYISNMLPIIDNYISIDPKRFVETKEPNYLVGVMKICVALMEDPKREADCPFAPKIIECILAHCRGMVDPLIPDIIKMLTQKLITASDPLLRLLVCDAIGAVSYYNPVLFLHICKAVGDEFTQELFNRWLSHLPAMRKSTRHEKMAVLGLSSLCLTPLGAAPRPLQTAFADVLAEIIRVLSVYKEDEAKEIAAEEARKEAEEEEDEEKSENTLKDLGEEEDAPEEQVDMEKFTSEIAEAMRMRQLASAAGMDEEAADYTSPIDDVDPFIFFATCLQVLSTREKPFYDHWAASLPAELGVLVQAHIAEAGERQKQLREAEEKEKADKESGGTAAEAD